MENIKSVFHDSKDDLELERERIIDLMKKAVPEDLMRQIDYFSRCLPSQPAVKIWTSSHGTGNAN